jgi:tetratricopeptide (TPR) repeat protein
MNWVLWTKFLPSFVLINLIFACKYAQADYPIDVEKAYIEQRYYDAYEHYLKIPERRRTLKIRELAANSSWALGLNQLALNEINTIFKLYPKENISNFRLLLTESTIQFQEERYGEVRKNMVKLLSLLTHRTDFVPLAGEAKLLLGSLALNEGDLNEASRFLKLALSDLQNESLSEAHYLLGDIAYKQGNFIEAVHHFLQVDSESDYSKKAVRSLLKSYLRAKNYKALKLWLKEATRLYPEIKIDSWFYYAKARLAIANKDQKQLLKILEYCQKKFAPSDGWIILLESEIESFFNLL